MKHDIVTASQTQDIEEFMQFVFPSAWKGIAARILETGATFADGMCKWAPRWSKIPQTKRRGENKVEDAFKSIIFRVHDCIHQLWGLPHPTNFSEDEFHYYKRTQMCGEVAVLTLTEFLFVSHLFSSYPRQRDLLWNRNALPLMGKDGPLAGKSTVQVAMRLDDLLHKKSRPKWVRDNKHAIAFVDDYVPMLEKDREQIDHNWAAMQAANWFPTNAPKARFGRHLDGLELTIWMIEDFLHLMSTDPTVDTALMEFNRERRSKIVLPQGWDS